MVYSYSRGHRIYYKKGKWRYADNNQELDISRPCKRCGRAPTPEGYDACLGEVKGRTSVCCGHGIKGQEILI